MQLQCSARSKQPGRGQHREGSAQQGERCITMVAPPAMARAPVTSPMALRSAWRRGSGAAVLCSPRTNAASACKGPLCQYSMSRGDRYPNQDSRIFRELSYVRIHVFMIDVSSPYHKFAYLGFREYFP
jgi:hypothetical protein